MLKATLADIIGTLFDELHGLPISPTKLPTVTEGFMHHSLRSVQKGLERFLGCDTLAVLGKATTEEQDADNRA